jgi:hypothetical protein
LLHAFAQLRARDDLVYQAGVQRPVGADRVTGEQDLQRYPWRHQPRQRGGPWCAAADLGLRDRERRVLSGHDEVALLGEQEPAGECHAVDRGDGRLETSMLRPNWGMKSGGDTVNSSWAISLRSPPAQKAFSPAPVRTSTRACASSLNRRTPSHSASRTAALSALRASGRSMVNHAAPSTTS